MTDESAAAVDLRRATDADGGAIGDVWLASWRATFDFPPAHPDESVRHWLAEMLLPSTEMWVAVEPAPSTGLAPDGDRVIAMLALSDSMVEQLYVAPDRLRRGIGSRLIELAKMRRPDGLDLFCFQVNGRARAFYEAHGFREIARGDGSGNEERQPDIRYAWRPG